MVIVKLMVAHLLRKLPAMYISHKYRSSVARAICGQCVCKRTVYCIGVCLGLYTSDTSSGLSATVNKVFGDITQSLQANFCTILPLGIQHFIINPFYSSIIPPFQIIVQT